MRGTRLIIWIVLLAVSLVMASWLIANRRRPLRANEKAAAAALLELHQLWEADGNRIPPFRFVKFKALGLKGVEASRFQASAYDFQSFAGIRWSTGYQLARQGTDDVHWTLNRIYTLDLPMNHRLRWRRALTTVTNAEGAPLFQFGGAAWPGGHELSH